MCCVFAAIKYCTEPLEAFGHSIIAQDLHFLPNPSPSLLILNLITTSIMAEIKPDVKHTEDDVVTDHHLLGMKQMETSHLLELTEEEKAIEKKLVKRIDWIILPLILTVYLLNWIDRSVKSFSALSILNAVDAVAEITMPRPAWLDSRMIST